MNRAMLTLICVPLLMTVTGCDGEQFTEPGATAPFNAGAGAGFGSTLDLEGVLGLPEDNGDITDSAAAAPFKQKISAIFFGPPPIDTAAVEREFRKWLNTIVLPVTAGNHTDLGLFRGLAEFWNWYLHAEVLFDDPDARFAKDLAVFDKLAAQQISKAIDGNIALCRSAKSIEALANSIFWFSQAESLDLLDIPTFDYDATGLESEIENGCADVVQSFVSLPDTLIVGTFHTTRWIFELALGTPPVSTEQTFFVEISSAEATTEQAAFTDTTGTIDRLVQADVPGTIALLVEACLLLPGRTTATEYVCSTETVTRPARAPTAPPPPPPPPPPPITGCSGTFTAASPVQVVTPAHLNAIAGYQTIDGHLFIQGDLTLVNVMLPCLRTVTGVLFVSNSFGATQAQFPALVEVGRQLIISANPQLTTASFPALQRIGTDPSTPGALSVGNNPLLASLDIGAVSISRNVQSQLGGLQLFQPLRLTQLNGLSTAISVDTLFFTLPADSSLTRSQFQAYKQSAPGVLQVCELPFGAGGARQCL